MQNRAGLDAARCRGALPCVHQRTAVHWVHGWPCVCIHRLRLFCLAVHPCRTPVPCAVLLCVAILDAQGFLEPLTILKIALEVLFSIKNQ